MGSLDLGRHRLDRHLTELPAFPELEGDVALDADNASVAANRVTVAPESLDDLKAWLGIPQDAIDHARNGVPLRSVDSDALPQEPFAFDELSSEQQEAVEAAAYNLLFGPVEPSAVATSPLSHVVDHLLAVNRQLTLIAGDELTVRDGQTITLEGPSCAFNSITIYGTGSIRLLQDCKVITDSLTYVPDQA
jgi:hypothetical protein